MPSLASVFDGIVDADPIVVAILIGAVIVLSIVFVWMRVSRGRSRSK